MQEIMKIIIDNRELYLYQKENSFIYGPIDITKEEKKIILKAFKQILPKGNIINLGTFTLENKKVLHLMSRENGYHIFYEQKENELKLLDKNCQQILNYLFNNQNEYVSKSLFNKSNDNFFKRIIKIGEKIVIVYLALGLTIDFSKVELSNSADDLVINNEQANVFINEESIAIETDDLYTFEPNQENVENLTVEEIERIIKNNQNLSEEEKNLFLSNPQIFIDNLAYFNKDIVKEQLEKLWIGYVQKSPNGTAGEYYGKPYTDKQYGILIYNATCFDDCDKEILLHEFCHALSDIDPEHRTYGQAYYESLNTQFNNEYFGPINGEFPNKTFDNGYSWLTSSNYLLTELLDQDTLKRFHAVPNPKIIVEALSKIIPDEEMAIKLLTNMDLINSYYFNFMRNLHDNNLEEYQLLLDAEEENKKIFKAYFETKYNVNIETQLDILYWWDRDLFYEYLENNYEMSSEAAKYLLNFTSVIKYKSYLNSENLNNELIVQYCSDIEFYRETFTLEQLLNGKGGEHYESASDIPYEKTPDDNYEIKWITPKEYLTVSLSDKSQNITK